MIYTKKEMVTIIHNAAIIYDSELCQKNRLIVYGAPNKPSYILTRAREENFCHLTGVTPKIDENDGLDLFYFKAKEGNLSVDDFEINSDGTTQLKMEVINQTYPPTNHAAIQIP